MMAEEKKENMTTDESRLRRLRDQAAKAGYAIRKDRVRQPRINHLGGYMLIDIHSNSVVAGSRFNLTLKGLEKLLRGPKGENVRPRDGPTYSF